MTDTISAKRARLIGQLVAAQSDRLAALDPALRLSRLLQIEELLQELFADDPDREEQYRELLLATCSLIEQIRAAYPALGEVETPAATSESRLTCEPCDSEEIEVFSWGSSAPVARLRADEPLPEPEPDAFLAPLPDDVEPAPDSLDEVRRAATEKRMLAKGYLQRPDGTWCKPPEWDPLGLAMPLWDELPDTPPPAPAPKTSVPSWLNEPRNYALGGMLVAAACSVALLPDVTLGDLPRFLAFALLAWAALGLWGDWISSSPKTSPRPYRGRCSECKTRSTSLHPFSGWCEECWAVGSKIETRTCLRCGSAVESGIAGSICASCTSPRRTVLHRCQRCYGSFPAGSSCETCARSSRPRCVRCCSFIEGAMPGSLCSGCWVDLER